MEFQNEGFTHAHRKIHTFTEKICTNVHIVYECAVSNCCEWKWVIRWYSGSDCCLREGSWSEIFLCLPVGSLLVLFPTSQNKAEVNWLVSIDWLQTIRRTDSTSVD